ncbi:S1C family serine protease [Aquibacillus rhizosphaerae]|uniref:Trypsin-like peptidase domain-containing protein n=1 Tax=Aquibacillus rhizosphaerae TaxID=3051431 RepID=A0ABT7LC60_9BACI|nr:trypsin-like peptidase domain-containing protein [Aquibacillus sp. LR5S19]MDL4842170.1 trypsin-like peptidase domain-containing protein [Aquibacillus sp. LR5S19]
MNKRHIYIPILLSFLLLALGVISIVMINKQWTGEPIELKNTLANQVTENKNSKDLKSIIHEAQKNVVQIETSKKESTKIGSGFLYNGKGDIITNAHVVKDADSITVKMANAQTYTAAVIGVGESIDVALIRVPQLANQSPAILDDSYNVEIGDDIIAVGSPLGFQNSVTLGIISGTNRTFSIDGYDYDDVYQISANITNGNSGGPLINRQTGKVIAINSAGTDEGGIGFSIPIGSVLNKVNEWAEEADGMDLVFSESSLNKNTEPEQFKKDSQYIIDYYFDSLAIRDYINAYALLGSELQTKTDYQSFRENYIHVVETEINNIQSEFIEESALVNITLQANTVVRKSDQTTKNETWNYSFFIGYENDQLKIIKMNKSINGE